MTDLSAFAEEGFNPKAWVNNICQTASDEALDRFLAEMEMRLQLAAEEIEAGLQDSSAQAMRRIPFAVQEIYRLQGDIQGMQDQVKLLAGSIGQSASTASASVGHIQELHGVKRNMEAACSTLREAMELSGMFTQVESVFASGDLPRVAELLQSMRASLALVGDLPEFKEGKGKLRALEDRLQSQVEGALASALAAHTSDTSDGLDTTPDMEARIRSLCGLLLAVDRYRTVESLYLHSRMARVQSLWEEVANAHPGPSGAASLPQWLPQFHTRLLPLLRHQVAWVGRVLPSHKLPLSHALMASTLDKVYKWVTARLVDRAVPVAALIPLSTALAGFATHVSDLLPADLPADQRAGLLHKALEPLEDAVNQYPGLESSLLDSELRTALGPEPSSDGPPDGEAVVRQLWDAVRGAVTSCCAAVDRCVALTGGSELPALAGVLDDVLSRFLARVAARAAAAVPKPGGMGAAALQGTDTAEDDGESLEGVGAALRLVVLATEAAGGALLRRVDAGLRATLATALPKLEAAAVVGSTMTGSAGGPSGEAGGAPSVTPTASSNRAHGPGTLGVDPLALRLAQSPERLQRAQKLAASLTDPRYTPLPHATTQADALVRAAQTAALDVLLARVHATLAGLPSLPAWTKRSASAAGGTGSFGLPVFSVEPQPQITHLGDYLMMLPQQLEVLFGDELVSSSMTQDEQDELAAQWLDLVVAGAGSAYAEAASRIPELSPQGGVQLAADVEYFCNVMSALHVAPQSSLLTLQLFAGMPDAEFPGAAKAALADGGADATTLRALATQRHLAIPA